MRLGRAAMAGVFAAATLVLPAGPALADSIRDREWQLTALDVAAAHKISQGAGVTVALVDTGVAKHRDLSGAVRPGTTLLYGQKGDGRDDIDGHGTELAGIIAGRGHGSNDGVLGIAPRAEILPIQAPLVGNLNGDHVAAAVDYAIAHHAGVINMSFGIAGDDTMHQAILKAKAANVVVVASAGNRTQQTAGSYPGDYPEVLAVGAEDRNGKVASFSVAGPHVDLVAPGATIMTIGNHDDYYVTDGTSGAAAMVSGAAALLRAKFPQLDAAEIVHRLTATATDAGPKGRDDGYGYGRLNIVKALTAEVKPLSFATASSTAKSIEPAAAAPPSGNSGHTGLIVGVAAVIAVLIVAVIVFGVIYARGGRSTQ